MDTIENVFVSDVFKAYWKNYEFEALLDLGVNYAKKKKNDKSVLIVYWMGRLCGGAHEISGIPALLWFCGSLVRGFMGWVLVWVVVVWMVW